MDKRNVNLILFLPDHLREMNEFNQMCSAEDKELNLLWEKLESVANDMDMYKMSENMCERWESFFGIKDVNLLSLDDRRQLIRGYFASQLPYTYEKMDMTLKSMCGEDYYLLDVVGDEYQVDIGIALESDFAYRNVVEVMRQMIPSHIGLNVYLIYNKQSVLGQYPHYILMQFTHDELRGIVIYENISAECQNLAHYSCDELQGINISHLCTYGMRKVV